MGLLFQQILRFGLFESIIGLELLVKANDPHLGI